MSRPIVIDLESSGLGKESYPIEVGFILEDGVEKHSWLIKREPGWNHWDPVAQNIHNITRQDITDNGLYAPDVANLLNKHLAGKTAYSDCREYDEFWIDVLFDKVGIKREFHVGSIQSLFSGNVHHAIFYKIRNDLYKKTVRHRAENDAVVIQEAYIQSLGETDILLNKKGA